MGDGGDEVSSGGLYLPLPLRRELEVAGHMVEVLRETGQFIVPLDRDFGVEVSRRETGRSLAQMLHPAGKRDGTVEAERHREERGEEQHREVVGGDEHRPRPGQHHPDEQEAPDQPVPHEMSPHPAETPEHRRTHQQQGGHPANPEQQHGPRESGTHSSTPLSTEKLASRLSLFVKTRTPIAKGYKVTPHCPRDQTSLSSHEVARGYRDVVDPSVYVKLPLRDRPDTKLLIWTTTPWTLISNTAVAANPGVTYVAVEQDGEKLILAKELMDRVLGEGDHVVVDEVKGSELAGLRYERPFDYVPVEETENLWTVLTADYVTTGEGAGLVLSESMAAARRVVALGRTARNATAIKTRQPLREVLVVPSEGTSGFEAGVSSLKEIVLDELNVKGLRFGSAEDVTAYSLKPNLGIVGPRYGRLAPELRRVLAEAPPEVGAKAAAGENVTVNVEGREIVLSTEELLIEPTERPGYALEREQDLAVALATELDDGLLDEGLIRKLVHKVQNLRRERGFEIEDAITVSLSGSERVTTLLSGGWGDYFKAEVLARSLAFDGSGEDSFSVEGETVGVNLARVG